jgi:molybdenum cofactor cytidylyltransferase
MGSCKQLLPLGDRPLIRRCLDGIIAAGVGEIVVVVGAGGDEVAAAVRHLPLTVVRNPDPASDMAASVRLGLQAVPAAATGVFIALADHPLVASETYRTLLLRHEEEPQAILIPVHEGQKGHPTLFPRPLLEGLATHATLRDIVRAHPGQVRQVPVADRGVILDIDTPEDYREVLRAFAELPPEFTRQPQE